MCTSMRCACAEMHMEPSGSWAMPASSPQIAHSTSRQLLVESGGHMCWRSTLAQHHTHHHQVLRALQMDATAAGCKAHAEHGPSSHKPVVQSARKTTACGVQQVAPPPALRKRAGSAACNPLVRSQRTAAFLCIMRGFHAAQGARPMAPAVPRATWTSHLAIPIAGSA